MTPSDDLAGIRIRWVFSALADGRLSEVQGLQHIHAEPCQAGEVLSVVAAHTMDEVLPALREVERLAADGHWLAGWVAYDAAPAFDAAYQVPVTPKDASQAELPLLWFAAFKRVTVDTSTDDSVTLPVGAWHDPVKATQHHDAIESVRAAIAAGDFYQVNLSTRLLADLEPTMQAHASPYLFDALRGAQGAGYHMAIQIPGLAEVLSVSPELFFVWDGHKLVTQPMKGTLPSERAAHDEDFSSKDFAENTMIVDLLRNDLSRIAVPGSVRVPVLYAEHSLATVRQMTSTIVAETPTAVGIVDIFSALFPCGSVTGAPKIAAMRAIAEHETQPRGVYCGAVGVIAPGGREALFNVAIRSLTLLPAAQANGSGLAYRAVAGVGSGLTWYSDAGRELDEWAWKSRFLFQACAGFMLRETMLAELADDGQVVIRHEALHWQRLQRSAQYFGFACDEQAWHEAWCDAVAALTVQMLPARLQLNMARDGRMACQAKPLQAFPMAGIEVALCPLPMLDDANQDSILRRVALDERYLRHKTSQRQPYELACQLAVEGLLDSNADMLADALCWLQDDGDAFITEFTIGNVVAEIDGECWTPPLSQPLLPGVGRALALEAGQVGERPLSLNDLQSATRLWLINSVRGWVPVRKLWLLNGQVKYFSC